MKVCQVRAGQRIENVSFVLCVTVVKINDMCHSKEEGSVWLSGVYSPWSLSFPYTWAELHSPLSEAQPVRTVLPTFRLLSPSWDDPVWRFPHRHI